MFQVIVELEGRVSGSRKKVGKRQQGYDQNVGPRKESKKSTLSCWCSWLWYRVTWRAKGRTMQCGTRPEGGGLVREFWAVIVKNCLGKWGRQGDRQTAAGSRGEKGGGMMFFFGSEAGVVVTLASLSAVVASLSVAVPLVLSALSPGLVVVAPVTVSSPGWRNNQSGREKY